MSEKLTQTKQINPGDWVDEYGDLLYRYALSRVSNENIAEDLVQDTFLSALKAVSDFKRDSSVETWLMSILKRKIIDYYRKKSQMNDKFTTDDFSETADFYAEGAMKGRWKPDAAPQDWRINPESQTETESFMHFLYKCMKDLSEGLFAVFTLRELEQLDTDAICKELGITSSNLWVRLHRARSQLRKCLEHSGFGKP